MKKYFIFFLLLQAFLIQSMDLATNCIELNLLHIIPDFIISRYSSFLDHETICSFAAVNKAYSKKTLTTSDQRKNLFIKLPPENYSFIKKLWHRYGSAYVAVANQIHQDSFFFVYTVLNGHDVISEEKQALFYTSYKDFPFKVRELPHKPFPFIEEKKVYFYGHSEKYTVDKKGIMMGSLEIERYCIDGSRLKCYLDTSNIMISLANLAEERYISILNNPKILKEIRNNRLVFKEVFY